VENFIDEEKLRSLIESKQMSFMQILQNFISEKYNLSFIEDIERQMVKIYKGAKISRQRFSKIGKKEVPTKRTIIRIGFSLKLPKDKMLVLLKSSGYFLGINSRTDIILRWCLENEFYDICKINMFLKKISAKEI
jgi:hypothetical protein